MEVRLEGVLDRAFDFDDAEIVAAPDLRRLLLDFSGVTDVHADAYALAEQAHRGEERGFKVAVYAPRPALFGLNRQALQLGAIREGESAGVFNNLEAARAWLRAG
ncbi:MAG: hypothetical protein ABI577_11940 [bacterium]